MRAKSNFGQTQKAKVLDFQLTIWVSDGCLLLLGQMRSVILFCGGGVPQIVLSTPKIMLIGEHHRMCPAPCPASLPVIVMTALCAHTHSHNPLRQ